MKYLIPMLITLCDAETIALILAKCISAILSFASVRGGKSWDTAKKIMTEVEVWTGLFNQVYEDDKMTQEEEKLVADAIKGRTPVSKVAEILGKKVSEAAEEKKPEENA